ncbi:MAG: hypothetical protein IJP89_05785 [Synergistaceae bacterium]|nr:hypothetical protein [Synergistaceae bacterium]
MKAKFFAPVILALVLLSVKAEAMPESSAMLTDIYCAYLAEPGSSGENAASFLEGQRKNSAYAAGLEKEISDLRKRQKFTQEKALTEIKSLVKSGKLPSYITEKGSYKYASGTNSAVPTENVRLRSQPNTDAKVIKVIKGGVRSGANYTPPEVCDYMGEWTNPQGERWVLVNYRPNLTQKASEKKMGWIFGDYVRLVTDENALKAADVYEHPAKYAKVDSSQTISPETLLRAYVVNPFKAEKNYKGKTVRLHGEITGIKADSGVPVVEFDSYFSDLAQRAVATCYVSKNDPLLAEIETGKNITIQGKISEVDTGLWNKAFKLTDCRIISAK